MDEATPALALVRGGARRARTGPAAAEDGSTREEALALWERGEALHPVLPEPLEAAAGAHREAPRGARRATGPARVNQPRPRAWAHVVDRRVDQRLGCSCSRMCLFDLGGAAAANGRRVEVGRQNSMR